MSRILAWVYCGIAIVMFPLSSFAADEQARENAMHHIASAQAAAAICSEVRLNETLVALSALMWNIDLSEGSDDYKMIADDARAQLTDIDKSLDEAGENKDMAGCAMALFLYGENGVNVPNLVEMIEP